MSTRRRVFIFQILDKQQHYNLRQNVNKHNRHKEKSKPSFELCDCNSKG